MYKTQQDKRFIEDYQSSCAHTDTTIKYYTNNEGVDAGAYIFKECNHCHSMSEAFPIKNNYWKMSDLVVYTNKEWDWQLNK